MSDVGLGATLELNITDALRRVDDLGKALDTATVVAIQADTSRVAPEVSAAVDAADSAVTVEADTTGISTEITAAVDAADTGVVITGDASELTGSITAAVDAADTNVNITGGVDQSLQTDVLNLGANLADASDQGAVLGKIFAALSVGAAAAGLRSLADSASDLAESTSKAGIVFGTEFPQIERFATGAADAVGLSTQAAFEATGTFGNLFQALGTNRAEAARLSPQVVQLAGDLASFNNIGTDEALEKLRSGLVGEIEPLRQLGVSFTALDVEAKAVALGLGAVGRELTEGEKVQARYALITEQTALAQGDFARTSDGLANQQRILQAELRNAAAAAGEEMLPAFLALVSEIRDAIPGLSQLAENVLPAVSDALITLAPLLGTTVDVLVALSPLVQLFAAGIGLIPDPVIQVAAALLVMNKALAITQALAGSAALAGIGTALVGASRAAVVAAGTFTAAGAGATGFAAALGALNLAALGPAAAIAALIAPVVLYNKVLGDAKKEGTEFGRSLRASFDPATASLSELKAASAELDEKIAQLSADVDDSFLGRNTINRDFNAALGEGIDQAKEFQAEIDAAAAALERAAVEAEFGPLIAQFTSAGDAARLLRQNVPAVESAIASLRLGGIEPTTQAFVDLAVEIAAAGLTEEEFAAAAARLGIDVETLKSFVDDAAAAVQNFADTAIGALPTVSTAFASTLEGAKKIAQETGDLAAQSVSAGGLAESLDEQASDVRAFTLRLAALTQEGFADVAGIIAQQGPELGGALAEELADALGRGDTVLVEQTRESLTNFNTAWTDAAEFLRTDLGPKFVVTVEGIAADATEAFGSLDLSEQVHIEAELAKLEMDKNGKDIAGIAAVEGESAARRYGEGLNLDEQTIAAAIAAGEAIAANHPEEQYRNAGVTDGIAYVGGVIDGMTLLQDDLNTKAQQLALAAAHAAAGPGGLDARSPSRLTRDLLGIPFAQGIVAGMEAEAASVIAAAERITADAANIATVSPEVLAAANAPSAPGSATAGTVPSGLVDALERIAVNINPGDQVVQNITTSDPVLAATEAARQLRAVRLALTLR